ncbi:MAG: helix-turn-helix domain-containing protein [Thermodesulfobacteriota bacterium]
MSSLSSAGLLSNPELRSLYEISQIPGPQTTLQDYFNGVMAILSDYFPIGYSVLLLHDSQKDSLYVEALYGIERYVHPHSCSCQKGVMVNVLESRKPAAIQNLNQEPLYEEVMKGTKRIEKLRPPLLCIPLISDDKSIGVININSLYGPRIEFTEDFQFLSILSAILTPVIINYQLKRNEPPQRSGKSKAKTSFLDEILEQKLTEVLNRIDPYVESKAKMGLLDDIIAVVEKILIKSALERMGNVQVSAAQFLGINRNTLRKKMKDFKIKTR